MWPNHFARQARYNQRQNSQIRNACITLDDAERKADLGRDVGTTDLIFMPGDVQP